MKVSTKIMTLLFAIVFAASLFGCTPQAVATVEVVPTEAAVAESTVAPAAEAAASLLTTDGRYPLETIKICVETFDPTDTQYMSVQDYFKFLSEKVFNVEFIYSEKIDSAEQELQFVENCGAAGAKGYIAYYNVSKAAVVAKAAELGIYYWGQAEEKDIYDAYSTNPYYLGSVINGTGDFDGMYAVTKAILDQGKTKFIYANGGADFGITMFINRKAGFQAAIDEAIAGGAAITVSEVPGFPNEAWFAAQGAALAGDVDAVVGGFGADVWVQPIAASGKTAAITVGSFGAVNDFYKQTFSDGSVSAIAAEPSERFGIAVAQIVNAVDGNADALKENGLATNLNDVLWIITSPADFTTLYDFEHGDGRAQLSAKLVDLVKNLNPDASVTTLQDFVKSYSLDSIKSK